MKKIRYLGNGNGSLAYLEINRQFVLKFCPMEKRTKFWPEIQAYFFWVEIIRLEMQFRPPDVLPPCVSLGAIHR